MTAKFQKRTAWIVFFIFYGLNYGCTQQPSKDSLSQILKKHTQKISSGVYAIGDKREDIIYLPEKSEFIKFTHHDEDTILQIGGRNISITKINGIYKTKRNAYEQDFHIALQSSFPNLGLTPDTLNAKLNSKNFEDILKKIRLKDSGLFKEKETLSNNLLNIFVNELSKKNIICIIDEKTYQLSNIRPEESIVVRSYNKQAVVSSLKSSNDTWFYLYLTFAFIVGGLLSFVFLTRVLPQNKMNEEVSEPLKRIKNGDEAYYTTLFYKLGLDVDRIKANFASEKAKHENNASQQMNFDNLHGMIHSLGPESRDKLQSEFDSLSQYKQKLEEFSINCRENLTKTLEYLDKNFSTNFLKELVELSNYKTLYEKSQKENKSNENNEKEMTSLVEVCKKKGDFENIEKLLKRMGVPTKSIQNAKINDIPIPMLEPYFTAADERFGSFLEKFDSLNVKKAEDRQWFLQMLVEMSLHYIDLIESQFKNPSPAEKKYADANVELMSKNLNKSDLIGHSVDAIEVRGWVIRLIDFMREIGIKNLDRTLVRGYDFNNDLLLGSGQPKSLYRYSIQE
jgi:hypothetical protein